MVHMNAWQWTELVGATIDELSTPKGQAFIFGGIRCWVAKERYRIEHGRFYVERWVARQSIGKWLGEFVRGSQYAKMRPIDGSAIQLMSTITKLIKQGSELISQGNAIIQKAIEMAKTIPDTELDAETAKIISIITKRSDDNAAPH